MAASPKYKIYSPENKYLGSLKTPTLCAILMAGLGSGYSVRLGHAKKETLWMEGAEKYRAAFSYDECAEIIESRCKLQCISNWEK